MAAPLLIDFKQHLNIPDNDTTDDAELQSMLDAAVNVVENIVGPLTTAPVTETHYQAHGPMLVTRRAPVSSLTNLSVRWYPGMAWTDLDVSGYELDPDTGAIRASNGWLFSGDVQITYVVGVDNTPPAVALATLIIAANLWETQRGAMPLPANSTDDDMSANVHFAPAIPNRAKTLLEPYALGPMVA